MATNDNNKKKRKKEIIITIKCKKEGEKSHWSCEKESETQYKTQHHRYYLHKNIVNINIMSYIQLKIQNIQAQCDKSTRCGSSIDRLKITKPAQIPRNTTPK